MFTKPNRSAGSLDEVRAELGEELLSERPEEWPEQPTTIANEAAATATAPITDLRVTPCLLADRDRPRAVRRMPR
jgi:hypothetical protein